jgi:hypothetical protein
MKVSAAGNIPNTNYISAFNQVAALQKADDKKTKLTPLQQYLLSSIDATADFSGDNMQMENLLENDPKAVMQAIEYLLTMENNNNKGRFLTVRGYVSQTFPEPSASACALYYISYLFTKNYGHADANVLVRDKEYEQPDGKMKDVDKWVKLMKEWELKTYNGPVAIEKAYDSYRSWFKKVKKIGLEKAREQKLDPLKGSGVSWYGN